MSSATQGAQQTEELSSRRGARMRATSGSGQTLTGFVVQSFFPVRPTGQGSLCPSLGESEGMVGAADPRLMVYRGLLKLTFA